MQSIELNNQLRGYNSLVTSLKNNSYPQKIRDERYQRARTKYPDDYQMQSIELNNQLRGYNSYPQKIADNGYAKGKTKYPDSYKKNYPDPDPALPPTVINSRNRQEGGMIMNMGGGDYLDTSSGGMIMNMGGGNYLDTSTGGMMMNMGGGDYLNTSTGGMIMNMEN